MANDNAIEKEVQAFVVYGEPASKANSRRLVSFGGKPRVIKSSKALSYSDAFKHQCRSSAPFEDDVVVSMTIYYASRRPDLDESLVLTCFRALRMSMTGRSKRNIFSGDWIRTIRGARSRSKEKAPDITARGLGATGRRVAVQEAQFQYG
jgi:hypothetical protein